MIGVVIPAHNEASLVEACLLAVMAASRHPGLHGEAVEVVVALDDCTDGTAEIVARHLVGSIALAVRNVGMARAAGARQLVARGARWLAFTDADSRVAEDWLTQQLHQRVDAVCGTVSVDDWSDHLSAAEPLRQHFRTTYNDADGHRHIHGANLGVSATAYQSVGGFLPRASGEDVALVNALQARGASIAWSAAPRVVTSARRQARAPSGFAGALCMAANALLGATGRPSAQ